MLQKHYVLVIIGQEVQTVNFSYEPLWRLLRHRKMKKKELMAKANVSKTTMDQMWRKKYVALSVLDRICTALDCEIQDVVKHKKFKIDEDGGCPND